MPASKSRGLLSKLEKSRLLSGERFHAASELCERFPDPGDFAKELIRRGWLTRWQLVQLSHGITGFWLGKYRLLDKLGAGGMGMVYKAEQAKVGRVVAVKVLLPRFAGSGDAERRFEREVRAVGSLSHPHIVAALDAGAAGEHRFLVMEYLDGKPLSTWIAEYGALPVAWACEVCRQAALGLDHAHRKGLVHRDVKPSNVVVLDGPPDERPFVKVLDLGLASMMGASDERLTETGQIMGTPDYIAPEQGENTRAADRRCDVFSLGVVLFEMIAGRLPFGGTTPLEKLMSRAINDAPRLTDARPDAPAALAPIVARMLARDPAERFSSMSEVAAALAPFAWDAQSPAEQGSTFEGLRRRALPTAEPGTGADPDLQRFVAHLSEAAAAPSPYEPLVLDAASGDGSSSKAARPTAPSRSSEKPFRPGTTTLVGATLAIALLGGLLWFFARPSGPPQIVIEWPESERRGGQIVLDGSIVALPASGEVRLNSAAGKRSVVLRRRGFEPFVAENSLRAGDRWNVVPEWRPLGVGTAEPAVELKRPSGGLSDQVAWLEATAARKRQWEETATRRAERLAELERAAREPSNGFRAEALRFAAEFSGTPESLAALRLAAARPTSLDSLPERSLRELSENPAAPDVSAVFASTDRKLHWGEVTDLALSPDRRTLASAGRDGQVILWDLVLGRHTRVIAAHARPVVCLCFSADGSLLATGGADGVARVWKATDAAGDGRPLHEFGGHAKVVSVAFSPDGKRLATGGGEEHKVGLWDLTTGEGGHTAGRHHNFVIGVAFSLDGRTLVSGSTDGTVKLWDAGDGRELLMLTDNTHPVGQFFFAPSAEAATESAAGGAGFRLTAISKTNGVWVWEVAADRASAKIVHHQWIYGQDGEQLVYRPDASAVWVGDRESPPPEAGNYTGRKIRLKDRLHDARDPCSALSLSPDGAALVGAFASGRMTVWDVETGLGRSFNVHEGSPATTLAFATPAAIPVTGHDDGKLRIWDAPRRHVAQTIELCGDPLLHLATTLDGSTLAAASASTAVLLTWPDDAPRATPRKVTLQRSLGAVASLCFTPDGRVLALGDNLGQLWLYDAATGAKIHRTRLDGESPIAALSGTPDGRAVVAGTESGRLLLVRTAAPHEAAWLAVDEEPITALAFSGAGGFLWRAAARPPLDGLTDVNSTLDRGDPRRVRGWDWSAGRTLEPLEVEPSGLTGILPAAGSDQLWTIGGVGRLASFSGEPLALERELWLGPVSGPVRSAALTPDGRHLGIVGGDGGLTITRLAPPPVAEAPR